MQVPADRVIALLTTDLADLHRENAILKVQVELLNAQIAEVRSELAAVTPAEPATSLLPAQSPLPAPWETTPVPDLAA